MMTVPLDRRSILDRMGVQLAGTVVARGLSAIAVIIIARQVGPETFGTYAASMTLAKISAVLFSLGLETWTLRAGARVASDRDLAILNGNVLTIKGALGALWFLLLVGIAPLVNPAIFPLQVLALCAAIVWLEEIALISWSAFGARLRNATASVLLVIFQGLVCAATLFLALQGADTLAPYLATRALAATAGAIISLTWMVRAWGIGFDPSQLRSILRSTAPFGVSVLLSVIYGSVDVILVAQLLGSTAAGIYAPASTLITTLYLVPTAAYNVMIPVLSRLYVINRSQLLRTSHRFLGASIALGALLGAFLWIAAPWIIGLLYGADFAASADLLRMLGPVLALHCVSFAFGAQLTAAGRQSRRVIVQGAACIANIAANLVLLSRFGVNGAVYAFLISEVVLVCGYWLLSIQWERDVRAMSPMHEMEHAP